MLSQRTNKFKSSRPYRKTGHDSVSLVTRGKEPLTRINRPPRLSPLSFDLSGEQARSYQTLIGSTDFVRVLSHANC